WGVVAEARFRHGGNRRAGQRKRGNRVTRVSAAVGPPVREKDVEILAIGGDYECRVAAIEAVQVRPVSLVDANDLAEVGPAHAAVARCGQRQYRIEALGSNGGNLGVVNDEELADSKPAFWNVVNRTAAHVVITLVKGIDRRIGIRIDHHINRRIEAERVVHRAEGAGDGSILVVSVPVSLPELAGVTTAIAAEKRIAVFSFDDAQGSVRPGEAVCCVSERRLRVIPGGLPLRGSRQFLVSENLGRAERSDALRASRDRQTRKNTA